MKSSGCPGYLTWCANTTVLADFQLSLSCSRAKKDAISNAMVTTPAPTTVWTRRCLESALSQRAASSAMAGSAGSTYVHKMLPDSVKKRHGATDQTTKYKLKWRWGAAAGLASAVLRPSHSSGSSAGHGMLAATANSQIAPRWVACAVPYLSPAQPVTVNRFQCSPIKKYSQKPGVRISAITYQGAAMASVKKVPLTQGRRCHDAFMLPVSSIHKPIGKPDSTTAIGPLASRPIPRPMNSSQTSLGRCDGPCSKAAQNPRMASRVPSTSPRSVITAADAIKYSNVPLKSATASWACLPEERRTHDHSSQAISTASKKYGRRAANSLTPNSLMLMADNHVVNGGLAQKGTP